MHQPIDFAGCAPFDMIAPISQRIPIVLNSPHSGRSYPPDFLAASRLDRRAIRRSEDSFVDELFLPATRLGAPLLRANFPRAWLDVNREPYELDPNMFAGPLPDYVNVRSIRVAGGLGTIARIVSDREEIYGRLLDVGEGLARIEGVYKPYHATLGRLLEETAGAHGIVLLIDCHSMPSTVRGGGRLRPDIVLGDRYGTSCAAEITDIAANCLSALGYAVSRNKPYAGGHITETYGEPGLGRHALQVEINRCLYMDEASMEPTAGFDRLAADLARFVARMVETLDRHVPVRREAAE